MLEAAVAHPVHGIAVLGLLWVRCMVCLTIAPVFALVGMPRTLRLMVATILAAWLWPMAGGMDDPSQAPPITQGDFVLLVLKDAMIGLMLGLTLAIPSWVAEGMGAMFDNQRGAMTGQTFNPMLNSPSTMATLLQYASILVLYESGGMRWIFEYLALVTRAWPPADLFPPVSLTDEDTLIALFNGMARGALLYFIPLLAVMALVEMAMSLISVYAPHLQAFQMSMPLKSLVGLFVLTALLGTMFDLWGPEISRYLQGLTHSVASSLADMPERR